MKNNNENNMNISEFIDYKINEYLKQKEVNELRKAIEEELESFRITDKKEEEKGHYKCNLDMLMSLPGEYESPMDGYYRMMSFTHELRKLAEKYGLGDIDFKMNIYRSVDIDDDWEE